MHNEKRATRFSSGALILMLVFIIILIVYSFIIAMVSVYFQSELDKLKPSLEHLKTELSKAKTRTDCICDTDSESEGSQGHVSDNESNLDEATASRNLLSCCTAHQETLKALIEEIFNEGKKRNRDKIRGRNHVTLGQVERLVESILRRNRTHIAVSSGIGNAIPVATHVTGSYDCFDSNEPMDAMLKVGRWNSENGISFSENVDVDDYHMIVPKSGIYNVYSQVGFQVPGYEDDTDLKEYLHYTVLISTDYSSKHINVMKSVRIHDGTYGSLSSFHSRLFKLKEGDKIYMKVYLPSSEAQLDCRQESTFMGMYLVRDERRV